MRLSIIRHGDPDYEYDTITASGQHEAEALVPRLMAAGISHCYHSPLGRAQATAAPFIAASGLSSVCLPWTAEWGGLRCPDQGVMLWDLDPRILRDRGGEPVRRSVGGPAVLERLRADMVTGSEALLRSHGLTVRAEDASWQGDSRDHLAVFCHCGSGLAWLAQLLDLPLFEVWATHWLAPTSVTTILFESRDGQRSSARAVCIGDTGHLLAAGLPVLPRGLKANTE